MSTMERAGPQRIRTLIVDDQALVRRGLALILSFEPDIDVLGEAADGIEAVEMARRLRPDVVLMDLNMPRKSGVAATREITAALPQRARSRRRCRKRGFSCSPPWRPTRTCSMRCARARWLTC
jgi:CheY-like chemotaxis protein